MTEERKKVRRSLEITVPLIKKQSEKGTFFVSAPVDVDHSINLKDFVALVLTGEGDRAAKLVFRPRSEDADPEG